MRPYAALFGLSFLVMVAGCAKASVQGDAVTSLEVNTMAAYDFAQRVQSDPGASPSFKAYAADNFARWRRSTCTAKHDSTWGPTLVVEANCRVQAKENAAFVRLEDLDYD